MRIILFSLLIFLSNSSYACKCVEYTDEEIFANAEEVLLVKVLATELMEAKTAMDSKVKVSFRVLESFKESKNTSTFVFSRLTNCSVNSMAGYEYVLYIPKNKMISKCTGSYNIFTWGKYGKDKLIELRNQKAI
jgi:hypothetical protein